jgi:hypothetical protein
MMAAAALRALTWRVRDEALMPARLSLARTAAALLDAARPAQPITDATATADPARHRVTFGDISLIAPPGTLNGKPLTWPHGPHPLGSDPPTWSD